MNFLTYLLTYLLPLLLFVSEIEATSSLSDTLISHFLLLTYSIYSVFQKSDAKIEITITATNLIRIKYPLSIFNYHLSGAKVANFNKIYCMVYEQQLFKKWNSKTEVSTMEKSP